MSKLLENKTAIITGASRGIGKGIALAFAQQGCIVSFTYSSSVEAAKIFGLEIISSNIQTIKNNETRFVIISKELSKNKNIIDKASLKFSLSHETGSLASVLNILKDYNLNLTKIQSLPIVEIPWKYSFFVDTTFSSIENFNDAINLINNEAESLKVLGIYKNQMK